MSVARGDRLVVPTLRGLRCVQALSRFESSAALHDNILFLGALPVFAVYWLDWLARTSAGKSRRPVPRVPVVALLAIAAVFAVVRNLPFAAVLRPN